MGEGDNAGRSERRKVARRACIRFVRRRRARRAERSVVCRVIAMVRRRWARDGVVGGEGTEVMEA